MFIPRNDKVLVRPDEAISETSFGMVLTTAQKPTTGVVVVGNKTITEGQRIVFSKFGFDEVVVGKETLYVISDPNVLGIFND